MKIKKIILTKFKRFSNLTITDLPDSVKLVLLVGPNGSGKSSVFEAFNYWYKLRGYNQTSNNERDFYLKNDLNSISGYWFDNRVDIKVINADISTPEKIRNKFYFRTAHRNEPDFTTQQLNRQGDPTNSIRFSNLMGTDSSVSQNYQRLISLTLAGLYQESNDSKNVKELREELIGKIKKSLSAVFDDLQLENVGDPLSAGSFFFTKGEAKNFHYKNLSAGEKSAFDLILDLVIKGQYYPEAVFCIDEPEIHMHTALQSKLLNELYALTPDNGQMWLATHSIGMLKKAQEIEAINPGTVAFLDFSDIDFDVENILRPTQIDATIWRKFLDLAFDDFAKLIAPETIIFCEGTQVGRQNPQFDAQVYARIFKHKMPPVCFVSVGSCTDLDKPDNVSMKIIGQVLKNSTIIKIVDRDERSEDEIKELNNQNIHVLSRRHLESYLLDDEIIRKLCIQNNGLDKYDTIIAEKNKAIKNSISRGNQPDDIKSAAGEIINSIKQNLQLTQCGSKTHTFLRDTMAHLVTQDTETYKILELDIFADFIPKGTE